MPYSPLEQNPDIGVGIVGRWELETLAFLCSAQNGFDGKHAKGVQSTWISHKLITKQDRAFSCRVLEAVY